MGNACIQKLILPADVSRQDTSNGVRVAYVNFYDIWVKNMVKYFKYQLPKIPKYEKIDETPVNQASASDDRTWSGKHW